MRANESGMSESKLNESKMSESKIYGASGSDGRKSSGAVRRWLVLMAVCLLIAGAMTGCQLAKADAGADGSRGSGQSDRLVGAMVTTEWVGLFDRWYAVAVDRPVCDENGNELYSTKDFVFEGIDGQMVYSVTVYEEDGQSHTAAYSDPGIFIEKNHLNVTDAGMMIELEGAIYAVAGEVCPVFYLYPIYQEPDGDVYLVYGDSFSLDTEMEGANMSAFYEEKITTTAGGESTEAVSSVKVTVEVVNRPERVVVSQLDGESQLVSRVEYPAGQVPEEIIPEAATEYIVVEMFKQGADGAIVDRKIYDKDDETFRSMAAGDRGFCEQTDTVIQWNN